MKIAVIGATGKAGHLIAKEAVLRGHEVTAIIRHPNRLTLDVPFIKRDLFKLTTADIKPFDVVVDAFNAPHGSEGLHVTAMKHLIDIFSGTPTRLVVVGGAGSLFVDDHQTKLFQMEGFPAAAYPTSFNMGKSLDLLRAAKDLNWTYISPSANFIADGPKKNHYQVGLDNLQVDAEGKSEISYADYAIAMLDEIENQAHLNTRINIVW